MPSIVWIVLISIAFSMKFSKDNYYRKLWTISTICHTCRARDVGFKSFTTSRWSLSFVSCIVTYSNRSLWPIVPRFTPPKDEAIYGTYHTPCQIYITYVQMNILMSIRQCVTLNIINMKFKDYILELYML